MTSTPGTSRVRSRTLVGAALLGAVGLLGAGACASSNEIDRAALTTTTSFAPTHSQAIEDEREALGIPDGDGGALCDALARWYSSSPEPDPTQTPAGQAADELSAYADRFDAEVGAAVPDGLEGDADAYVEALRAAAASLEPFRTTATSVTDLLVGGQVPAYEAYLALLMPNAYGPEVEEYANAFIAWIVEPCGPKPLRLDLVEVGATTTTTVVS